MIEKSRECKEWVEDANFSISVARRNIYSIKLLLEEVV